MGIISKIEQVPEPPSNQIESDVQHLKEWMAKEPHLPKMNDADWLRKFLYHNKFRVEKTKSKIDGYYTIRNKYPQWLKNRDPNSPELTGDGARDCQVFLSKGVSKDGSRLVLLQVDSDPEHLSPTRIWKKMTMLIDLMLLEADDVKSFIFIINASNIHYKHFLRSVADAPGLADLFLTACTERVEMIHVINSASFVELAVKAFGRFFPKKYNDRTFVHTSTHNTILDMVDEELLPSDFGGKGLSSKECEEWTYEKLKEYRNWFLEQDNICTNEALRRMDDGHFEEMKGSFRKLEVD